MVSPFFIVKTKDSSLMVEDSILTGKHLMDMLHPIACRALCEMDQNVEVSGTS